MKNRLRIAIFLLVISLLLPVVSAKAATNYTGGLLDGKPGKVMNTSDLEEPVVGYVVKEAKYNAASESTTLLTDNNESTLNRIMGYGINKSMVLYKLDADAELTSFRLKSSLGTNVSMMLFKSDGSYLGNYIDSGHTTDGRLLTLSTKKQGVRYVALVSRNYGQEDDVFEFNVYGTLAIPVDTTPPIAPLGLNATAGNTQVSLSWTANAEPDISSYKIYKDGILLTTVATNNFLVTNLTNGTLYTFQISAVDTAGNESVKSNVASATPTAPVTAGRALLVVTLTSGLEKEYDLPMTDVNAFIAWYNGRATGTGSEIYTFNKTYNLAKFISRKDYVAFDKIETFEVNEYNPN